MKRPDLKKMTEGIKAFSLKSYIPRRPESVWFLILAVFIAANIVSFSWSIVLFLRINDIEEKAAVATEDTIGGVETINRTELEDLLEVLHTRSVIFDSLTQTVVQSLEDEEESVEDEEDEGGEEEENSENTEVGDGEESNGSEQGETEESDS